MLFWKKIKRHQLSIIMNETLNSLCWNDRLDFVKQLDKLEFAFVGCFGFYAGKPDMEIVRKKPEGFTIMVPQNKEPLVI